MTGISPLMAALAALLTTVGVLSVVWLRTTSKRQGVEYSLETVALVVAAAGLAGGVFVVVLAFIPETAATAANHT